MFTMHQRHSLRFLCSDSCYTLHSSLVMYLLLLTRIAKLTCNFFFFSLSHSVVTRILGYHDTPDLVQTVCVEAMRYSMTFTLRTTVLIKLHLCFLSLFSPFSTASMYNVTPSGWKKKLHQRTVKWWPAHKCLTNR